MSQEFGRLNLDQALFKVGKKLIMCSETREANLGRVLRGGWLAQQGVGWEMDPVE